MRVLSGAGCRRSDFASSRLVGAPASMPKTSKGRCCSIRPQPLVYFKRGNVSYLLAAIGYLCARFGNSWVSCCFPGAWPLIPRHAAAATDPFLLLPRIPARPHRII